MQHAFSVIAGSLFLFTTACSQGYDRASFMADVGSAGGGAYLHNTLEDL